MVSSWFSLIVIALLLTVPGALLLWWGRRWTEKFSSLDLLISAFLLSGVFNFLFFLFRATPPFRISIYLLALGAVAWFALRGVRWSRFAFKKSWGAALAVFLLGAVLVGYPFHSLNLSRLSPNPGGGDVELFLFKTHLLETGYSIFDDPYAHQVNFYPTFTTANIALTTLLTGEGTALVAESYRVVMTIFIFWMIYALGRALRLRESDSVLLALFSLYGYSIWSHLDVFVAAGLAFFPTLIFMYFLLRALFERQKTFWIVAGVSGSLVVHSHLVHGIFAGLFTLIALIGVAAHDRLRGARDTSTLLLPLKWFTVGTAPLILIYLLPLVFRYGLHSTSTWYLAEEFNTTVAEFLTSLLQNPHQMLGVILTLIVWVLAAVFHKKRPAFIYDLLPFAHLYGAIFFGAVAVRLFALRMHHLAIYIDAGDFFTLTHGMSWLFVILIFHSFFKSFAWEGRLRTTVLVIGLLLIVPFSPLTSLKPSFMWRYKAQIWDYTKLPMAQGQRAVDGNVPAPEWDDFGRAIEAATPLNGTAILMNPGLTHTLGSHCGRRILIYAAAHSNVFLDPSLEERIMDHTGLFENSDPDHVESVIRKYGATHVLVSSFDSSATHAAFATYPFLQEVPLGHWMGTLYKTL